jgi:microcystin-dependent protein
VIPTSAHNEALSGDTLYSAFLNHEWRSIVLPFVIRGMAAMAAAIEDESARQDFEVLYGAMIDDFYNEEIVDGTPVGTIVAWAGVVSTIPAKWQICGGHLLDVDDYPELRAALDTPFDDNTFLTVPDLRDRFIYGMGTGTLGATGGAATVALAINEIPAHDHVIGTSSGQGSRLDRVQRGDLTSLNTQTTSSVGSGAAHQNLPPYMRLFYIMKVLP